MDLKDLDSNKTLISLNKKHQTIECSDKLQTKKQSESINLVKTIFKTKKKKKYFWILHINVRLKQLLKWNGLPQQKILAMPVNITDRNTFMNY